MGPRTLARAALVASAVVLAACTGEEEPTNTATLRPPGSTAGDVPDRPVMPMPRGETDGPLDAPGAPTVDPEVTRAAKEFVEAMSTGDLERAGRLFMPRETFNETFRASNQGDLTAQYDDFRHLFEESLKKQAPALKGAAFVRVELQRERAPTPHPAGASFDELLLARQTLVLNDIAIRVRPAAAPGAPGGGEAGGQETTIPFEAMFKTGAGWRVVQPIQTGIGEIRQRENVGSG